VPNGIELGGHEEAEAEGKRRLQEILTESVPGETWQTGGRSLSRMRNGARCSNCRSRVARAIGRRAKAHRSARACRSYGFFPRQKLIASHRLVSLACAAHAKKERAPVRGEGRPNISSMLVWVCRADQPYNDRGARSIPDRGTRARLALGLYPAIRNCIMRSTILLKLERKHKSWLKLVLAPIGDRRPSFMVAVEATGWALFFLLPSTAQRRDGICQSRSGAPSGKSFR
jgi:hypothetical protein